MGADRQGELMAVVSMMESCVVPFAMVPLFNSVWTATIETLPAAFAYVGAGFYIFTAILALVCVQLYARRGLITVPRPDWGSK